MFLLYISPSVIIGQHEWRVRVMQSQRSGHVQTVYQFRPLMPVGVAERSWLPITKWPGRKPKYQFFKGYLMHAKHARKFAERKAA